MCLINKSMCNLRTIKHQEHISGLYLEGGNPACGFVSGLTSSLTASTVQNLGGGKIATVIGGSLSGGVGAAVVGGNFYEGAVFGLMVSSLNHVAHEASNQVQKEIAKVRARIAQIAVKKVGSSEYNYDVAKDNFGKKTNKCNKFVHDVITEAGVDLPTPNGGYFGPKEYPINAGQWADPNYKIEGWEVVTGRAQSGDVIALPMSGSNYTGHVGIVVTSRAYTTTISANGDTIVANDLGFRQHQINKVTIRRYVGK